MLSSSDADAISMKELLSFRMTNVSYEYSYVVVVCVAKWMLL